MIKIRRLRGTRTETDEATLEEVQAIMRAQFPLMDEADVAKLPEQLTDPLKYRFVTELLVSEDSKGQVKAFAILLNAPDLHFAYLETISAAPGRTGGGLGAHLYQVVREQALRLGAKGLYFECLPDDPHLSPDPKTRRQNAQRLKFYERYGARPIMGTAYETPLKEGDTDSPYLVFDGLGKFKLPAPATLARNVEAILDRKYAAICPPGYIEKVTASVRAARYALREPRYSEKPQPVEKPGGAKLEKPIALIVNDRHSIHHIRERGYVEAPVRVAAIQREILKTDLFEPMPAREFPDRFIREVHDSGLVDYIKQACAEAPEKKSVYPYVFPVRNATRQPKERSVLSGYWCIDTFTPINRNAYPAARHAVDCSLTAAEEVLKGRPLAYALVRPPGHHAEHRTFGGFCYFCNSAIAAHYLSRHGKVAILDIDYHHGNGQQDIFYERDDVLTVSVHGHPSFAYPYFTGFTDERGRGRGAGFNVNIALDEHITPDQHRAAVAQALKRIARHDPDFLVVSVGFDTAKADPTGTWSNEAADFVKLGKMIGAAGFATVVIQEGGYRIRTLGTNARNFFTGLAAGTVEAAPAPRKRPQAKAKDGKGSPVTLAFADTVTEADVELIRALVASTDMFTGAETAIAVELAEERISKGRQSGYEFILAQHDGRTVGYACYGPTPATDSAFDLYWIVVSADAQGLGIGRQLLARSEQAIRALGGKRIYVDTSSQESYAPTRAFYRRTGFRKVAELPDFYRAGDNKIIFEKAV
ncbi:MAG: GNAT family N-acetyltransferase [Alphaproteobacteria bacterium]|nr:GNAT family N-acetyltransferase [Alphaproteobacteria bacterium]